MYGVAGGGCVVELGSVRKALILGDAALKTASEGSFTTRKVERDSDRSSAVFALPELRLKTSHTEPWECSFRRLMCLNGAFDEWRSNELFLKYPD